MYAEKIALPVIAQQPMQALEGTFFSNFFLYLFSYHIHLLTDR
jgi:hypothetical protein